MCTPQPPETGVQQSDRGTTVIQSDENIHIVIHFDVVVMLVFLFLVVFVFVCVCVCSNSLAIVGKRIRQHTEKKGKEAPVVAPSAAGPSTEEAERLRRELQAEVEAAKEYRESLQM